MVVVVLTRALPMTRVWTLRRVLAGSLRAELLEPLMAWPWVRLGVLLGVLPGVLLGVLLGVLPGVQTQSDGAGPQDAMESSVDQSLQRGAGSAADQWTGDWATPTTSATQAPPPR